MLSKRVQITNRLRTIKHNITKLKRTKESINKKMYCDGKLETILREKK